MSTLSKHTLQAGKNFSWMTASQIVLRLIGLVFFIFMTHILRDTGMGQYGFISSFVVMWFFFIDFGVGGFLLREWAKAHRTFRSVEHDFYIVFTFRLVFSLIIFVPYLYFNWRFDHELLVPLLIAFLSTFLAIFANLADIYFQANNMFRYPAIRQILEKLITVIIGTILLLIRPDVSSVFVAAVCAQCVSLAYYFLTVLPFNFRLVFDWERSLSLIRRGLPFLFIIVFTSIYNRIDIIMLRFMDTFASVGWYSTSYKFLEIAGLFAAGLFIPAIFPVISRLYNDKKLKKEFDRFFYKTLRIIYSSGLLISLGFIFFAPWMIRLMFPATFEPSILALRILIIAQVIAAFSLFFNNLLYIQNKEKLALAIIVISAMSNILLNLVLIPKYSLYGAAWATVLAEVINFMFLQHHAVWRKDRRTLLKMLLLLGADIFIIIILRETGMLGNLFLGTGIIITNIIVLLWSGLFLREDLLFFIEPMRTKLSYMRSAYED